MKIVSFTARACAAIATAGILLIVSQAFVGAEGLAATQSPGSKAPSSSPVLISGAWGSPNYFSDTDELTSLESVAAKSNEYSAVGLYRSGQGSAVILLPNGSPGRADEQVDGFSVSFKESIFTESSLRSTKEDARAIVTRQSAALPSFAMQYDSELDLVTVSGNLSARLLDELNDLRGVHATYAGPVEF